jgi:phosphoenolpyruvate-protein kinase (PTS system EI component)
LVYGLDLTRPIPNTTLDIPNGVVEFDKQLQVPSRPTISEQSMRAEKWRTYKNKMDDMEAEGAILRAKLMKTVRMLFPMYVDSDEFILFSKLFV